VVEDRRMIRDRYEVVAAVLFLSVCFGFLGFLGGVCFMAAPHSDWGNLNDLERYNIVQQDEELKAIFDERKN